MQYIELNTFLKKKGIASTGGQAKILIRSGQIKVNGLVETRNKKKLIIGDNVALENADFVVEEQDVSFEKTPTLT